MFDDLHLLLVEDEPVIRRIAQGTVVENIAFPLEIQNINKDTCITRDDLNETIQVSMSMLPTGRR
ncbi:MAG: hypothetical protein OEQ39_12290 [Gammaproteobacteria bacterium]|nr:hypothetical protein [Gammaproteobacteria bacterium]